jgi:hypothetical protein
MESGRANGRDADGKAEQMSSCCCKLPPHMLIRIGSGQTKLPPRQSLSASPEPLRSSVHENTTKVSFGKSILLKLRYEVPHVPRKSRLDSAVACGGAASPHRLRAFDPGFAALSPN